MSQTVAPAFFVGCINPNFGAAPSVAQINMGPAAVFYDMGANPRIYYAVSADLTSFTPFGATGSGPSPATTVPLGSSGSGVVGTGIHYARDDHQHPSEAPDPATATPLAASGTGAVGTGTDYARDDHKHPVGGGVPTGLATAHVFANADNDITVLASGTPNYVLNTGLMAGWGVSVKGAFTLTGTATPTDLRSVTGVAWCCIQQTAADGSTYDLVGTK